MASDGVPPAAQTVATGMLGTTGAAGADVHHDIARDIGQQVEMMIMDAKNNSESKVGKEINKIKLKMESMNDKIKRITERLGRLEPGIGGLLKADVQKNISKLEEVWEGEVGTLKHELWQTIQAHNHNADLLKHHKDAIDQIQNKMTDSSPNPELEQAHAQLMQVDKIMQREALKEQQMDQLMQRLSVVQQQLSAAVGPWPSGIPPNFAMSQAPVGSSASGASAAAGKKTQRKVTKATRATKSPGTSQQVAPTLRAEAPEFVPTTSG